MKTSWTLGLLGTEAFLYPPFLICGFPGGSAVKNLPANSGDLGSQSQGLGDLLEKETTTNSSIPAMDRGASWATVHGQPRNNLGTKQQQQHFLFAENRLQAP